MNNQDIKILLRVRYAMKQVESIHRRIEWEDDRRRNISQRYDRLGAAKGGVPKGLDEMIAELDALREEEICEMREYVQIVRTANEIVHGIQDATVRLFVQLYYVEQKKLSLIALMMDMSRRKLERIRQSVESAERMSKIN